MEVNSFLSISQLSFELDSGEAIIKFLIKRFKKWIPGTDHLGQTFYRQRDLITLIFLLDKINKGILPSKIEEELNDGTIKVSFSDENSLTEQYKPNLQERKIKAIEQRASAEEKKACAIEKSIDVETLKIEAMNNIAIAISNFNIKNTQSAGNEQIKINSKTDDLSQSLNTDETPTYVETTVQIDDLSKLIDNNALTKEIEIDNLASLLDNDNLINAELDDLSILIQDDKLISLNTTDIDDLSALLDVRTSDNYELDDLSLLIQDKEQGNATIDDLSILIKEKEASKEEAVDDLSKLIDIKSKNKSKIQKPEFSPEDDFEGYKSEIINIIIDLKNQGSTEEETLEQFNQQGILTFSGKPKWSIKTISQIYQLINNAA